MAVASLAYNYGEFRDDSGYSIPEAHYKDQIMTGLCQSGCKGFCDQRSRPTPASKQKPAEGANTSELMAWCGTYGGDQCLTSIGKLRRLPKDLGIDNQQAFFVFGCLSGGKKSCKEVEAVKGETRKIYEEACTKKKSYLTCPRYAALLVMSGSPKIAREVLLDACQKAKDASSCIALDKHDKGPMKK